MKKDNININKLLELLNKVKVEGDNQDLVDEIRLDLIAGDIKTALQKLEELKSKSTIKMIENPLSQSENIEQKEEYFQEKTQDVEEDFQEEKQDAEEEIETEDIDNDEFDDTENDNEDKDIEENDYPKTLQDEELERIYLGLLLSNPRSINMYYFIFEDCLFGKKELLNIYKSVLFTEGAMYSTEIAKKDFNFPKENKKSEKLKLELKKEVSKKDYNYERIYIDLKKLFILRKYYNNMPIKATQEKIAEIRRYKLYDNMSVEEVESAINQVIVTGKFKQAVLNKNVTEFLLKGDNSLTNGLELPFPILSSVFKGIRKGETMAFAMPSNSGKSRFTINLAAYLAFYHKKKVLVISNEMSEEKMKLCLITTILNNLEIQKMHGQLINKTEGELLEFKFRADDTSKVKVDEDGFVIQEEKETRKQFVERLKEVSSEFNRTIKATEWLNKEINNSIYFINITDHTNDELKKVITNYYYKEKIEYMFYDTMKTDTQNIGNSEEIKKTATIISNLAQNFNIYIGYTLQLAETTTLPINLTINDLSVSRTVKEVLDTLCLLKQIDNRNLNDYEYSIEEVDTKFYELKKYKDPDVRYYACVVDKNRAGSKPRVVFKLNLAYNRWEELGYLRLKEDKNK